MFSQVFSPIKKKISKHKTLVENFSYLSLLQGFNILLPLITYPYLIKTLGVKLYGLVIFAQVIATYFGLLIDFGFKISGTKEISINRNDKKKLSEIVSSILLIKISIWILSLVSLIILVLFLPGMKENKWLYLLSFLICFNDLLFPQWYFQGIERMKYITIINLISRLSFLILIFILVKTKHDFLYIPLLNGFGAFLAGLLGLGVIFWKEKIKFILPSFSILKIYFRKSSAIFTSNILISIKDRLNIFFIGTSLGMAEVAIYDLAIKIMNLFIQPTDIVNTTIYPKMSKEKNLSFLMKVSTISFLLLLTIILIIQPFLKQIIFYLGIGNENAILPVRLILLSPLIMVWSIAIGRNCLLTHGKYKEFTLGMGLTSILYLCLIALAYWKDLNRSVLTFVIITVLVFLFELIYRWVIAKKLKLI